MLTLRQVEKICETGVDITFSRKRVTRDLMGEYDPGTLEAVIYLANNPSEFERDITLLHEMIHARDDMKAARLLNGRCDDVEQEAKETYQKRPYVLQYIKEFYGIK